MLCQELHEALVAVLPLPRRPSETARKASLSRWTGCNSEGERCGERKKKRRCERQALVSKEDLRVSRLRPLFASFGV